MRFAPILAASILATLNSSARAAEPPSLPDPIMTPGAVDPAATRDVVCNGTTRARRLVSSAMKSAVLAAYNIPDADSPFYEIDHLVPLAIGGANVVANLWPEPVGRSGAERRARGRAAAPRLPWTAAAGPGAARGRGRLASRLQALHRRRAGPGAGQRRAVGERRGSAVDGERTPES